MVSDFDGEVFLGGSKKIDWRIENSRKILFSNPGELTLLILRVIIEQHSLISIILLWFLECLC